MLLMVEEEIELEAVGIKTGNKVVVRADLLSPPILLGLAVRMITVVVGDTIGSLLKDFRMAPDQHGKGTAKDCPAVRDRHDISFEDNAKS